MDILAAHDSTSRVVTRISLSADPRSTRRTPSPWRLPCPLSLAAPLSAQDSTVPGYTPSQRSHAMVRANLILRLAAYAQMDSLQFHTLPAETREPSRLHGVGLIHFKSREIRIYSRRKPGSQATVNCRRTARGAGHDWETRHRVW